MSFRAQTASPWQRIALERQATANTMARICIGLFIVIGALTGITYTATSQQSNMCADLARAYQAGEQSPDFQKLTLELVEGYCE